MVHFLALMAILEYIKESTQPVKKITVLHREELRSYGNTISFSLAGIDNDL